MKKKNKKNHKILLATLLILAFGCVFYGGYKIFTIQYINHQTQTQQVQYGLHIEENANATDYQNEFQTLKAENPDFVGWIKFDSNLINLPIVQGLDNEYYMTHDFGLAGNPNGTPFLSSDQPSLNSNNLTIFGHYVYADESLVFGPLSVLKDENNYIKNRYFEFSLENEVRTYQIVSVIRYTPEDEVLFLQSSFTPEEWERYIDYINTQRLYDTGIMAESSDRFVVLQTCIRNEHNNRLLVIGKEIDVEAINNQ